MLSYDFTAARASECGKRGLTDEEWTVAVGKAIRAKSALRASFESPMETFLNMPDQACDEIERLAAQVRDRFKKLVVVGIGGSSLGTRAAWEALTRPYSKKLRNGEPRIGVDLHFVENIDPIGVGDLLDTLDLENTAFNIVTKSGSTIETMSSFFVIRDFLTRTFGEEGANERLFLTTDPVDGALRETGTREGMAMLPIPPGVGGRFSVLSAVGLFPLAAAGIDIKSLLEGASAARERGIGDDGLCPAAAFAAVQVGLYNKGVTDVVFMPYVNRMSSTSDWFVQLWAESLGKKRRSDGAPVGPSPFPALGVRDQHSILQLLMEGPANKNVVFVVESNPPISVLVPPAPKAAANLRHLLDRPIVDALHAEQRGVAAGLRESNRPTSEFRLNEMNGLTFGALIMTLEMATALAGVMLDVNPFDQPGVELGKLYAHGILGRASLTRYAERLDEWESNVVRSVVRVGTGSHDRVVARVEGIGEVATIDVSTIDVSSSDPLN